MLFWTQSFSQKHIIYLYLLFSYLIFLLNCTSGGYFILFLSPFVFFLLQGTTFKKFWLSFHGNRCWVFTGFRDIFFNVCNLIFLPQANRIGLHTHRQEPYTANKKRRLINNKERKWKRSSFFSFFFTRNSVTSEEGNKK